MAVPKRKSSKRKVRTRKASHRHPAQLTKPCPNCGAAHQSHRVCPSCGHYRGRQVVTVKVD